MFVRALTNGDWQCRQLDQALAATGISLLLYVDVSDFELMLGGDFVQESDVIHVLAVETHVLKEEWKPLACCAAH